MVTNTSEKSFDSILTENSYFLSTKLQVSRPGGYTLPFTCNDTYYCAKQTMTFREIYNGMPAFRYVLDISGANENGEIIMWPSNGGDNQKWHFDEDMTIRSELGHVLDVEHASTDSGSGLIAFSKQDQENQKFRILPVGE